MFRYIDRLPEGTRSQAIRHIQQLSTTLEDKMNHISSSRDSPPMVVGIFHPDEDPYGTMLLLLWCRLVLLLELTLQQTETFFERKTKIITILQA
jgi:hypothetical protein